MRNKSMTLAENQASPTPEEIADLAFQLWSQEGGAADGTTAEQYWTRAEERLLDVRSLAGADSDK